MLEVLLAMTIFAIAIPTIASLFSGAVRQSVINTKEAQALFLAGNLMNEISQRRYWESAGVPGNGPEISEISGFDRRGFNDVGDYAIFSVDTANASAWGPQNPPRDETGTALTSFAGFSQSVSVVNVSPPSSGPTPRANLNAQADGSTPFKLVTVTISWESNLNKVQLYKIFAQP